jgi:hypothetical protein
MMIPEEAETIVRSLRIALQGSVGPLERLEMLLAAVRGREKEVLDEVLRRLQSDPKMGPLIALIRSHLAASGQ